MIRWLKRLYYRWLELATEGSLDDETDAEQIARLEGELATIRAKQRSL